MSAEWKSGDVAIRSYLGKTGRVVATTCAAHPGLHWHLAEGGWDPIDMESGPRYRPLAVIDPEDREQIASLVESLIDNGWRCTTAHGLRDTLREFADPKPTLYREHSMRWAPWPLVNECHSSHHDDHECPQCAWEHEHDWVAWVDAPPEVVSGPGVPIRCSKCGGRKCDAADCALMRHTHNHDEAAA